MTWRNITTYTLKKHEGLFIINQQLEPGTYQAFVDVTPNHVYSVHPIELQMEIK